MSRFHLSVGGLVVALLVACTTPRPLLPQDGSYQPPPEANFDERPDVIQINEHFTYDKRAFQPPVYVDSLPGGHVISARAAQGTSDAYVYYVIEKDGQVRQVKVVVKSGQPEVDEAIEHNVQRWRFRPATLNGEPVAVATGTIYRLSVIEGK
ncbi:MAG: TonB family protein [Rhizobacter sp.]